MFEQSEIDEITVLQMRETGHDLACRAFMKQTNYGTTSNRHFYHTQRTLHAHIRDRISTSQLYKQTTKHSHRSTKLHPVSKPSIDNAL